MATQTTHYGLIQPEEDDFYDVGDFNENMEAIDQQLFLLDEQTATIDDNVGAIKALIGTPEDSNENTIFGRLSKSNGKFYVPSQTEGYIYTAEEIANVNQAALSWVGISTLGHFVLGRIQAKHSGTIRIRTTLSVTTSQNVKLVQIFDTPIEAKLSAPTGSGIITQSTVYTLGALFTSANLSSSVATTTDLVLNVQEGSTYTVVLTTHSPTMVNLIEFGFYYETVDKEALEEFPTRKIIS